MVKQKGKKNKKNKKYIRSKSFTEAELIKFSNALKKLREKKRTKKHKKVALTNSISYLNLLYNADKERRKKHKKRKNLLKTHPFRYPSLIPDKQVDNVWNATKIRKYKRKRDILSNFNDVYRQLAGFNLINPISKPAGKLPKHQRGAINIVPAGGIPSNAEKNTPPKIPEKKYPVALPVKPSYEPPRPRVRKNLPNKPSSEPPRRDIDVKTSKVDDDESSSDSSTDTEEY